MGEDRAGPRSTRPPRVQVLLASYNGRRWLDEQIDSVLTQEGVDLELVVSDDMSSDGTWQRWQERAAEEPRIRLLARTGANVGAAANFYRLLAEVEVAEGELIALADQDDVWLPGKLAAQAALLRAGGVDGVSSNVTAVGPDGSRAMLRKDFPQRRFDFLFEGPGPGCTFVFSARLARLVQRLLRDEVSAARRVDFHDWLVYGVCRARGWPWAIRTTPTVDYRQHTGNAFGANLGVRSAVHRLGLVRNDWHREQAVVMTRVAIEVAPAERQEELRALLEMLTGRGFAERARLLWQAPQLRRRPRDRVLIGALIAAGVW